MGRGKQMWRERANRLEGRTPTEDGFWLAAVGAELLPRPSPDTKKPCARTPGLFFGLHVNASRPEGIEEPALEASDSWDARA